MTNTKKMTNAQALAIVAQICHDVDTTPFVDALGFDAEDLANKIDHMADVAAKRAAAPKKPTKAQRETEQLAIRAAEAMKKHGEAVGTKWIMANVSGIMTAQKATAVMTKAIALGLVAKDTPVKGSARWIAK